MNWPAAGKERGREENNGVRRRPPQFRARRERPRLAATPASAAASEAATANTAGSHYRAGNWPSLLRAGTQQCEHNGARDQEKKKRPNHQCNGQQRGGQSCTHIFSEKRSKASLLIKESNVLRVGKGPLVSCLIEIPVKIFLCLLYMRVVLVRACSTLVRSTVRLGLPASKGERIRGKPAFGMQMLTRAPATTHYVHSRCGEIRM